jgi:uncharacterized protein
MKQFPQFLFDFVFLIIIGIAQWRIGRKLLSAAVRRCSPRTYRYVRWSVIVCAAALLLGFLLSVSQVGTHAPALIRWSGWLRGFTQLWLFSSTFAYLIYLMLKLLKRALHLVGIKIRSPREFDPRRRKLINAAASAAIATPFAVLGFGAFVERTNFGVREIDVPIPGLPDDLNGFRIVQISDIHLSPYLSESEFSRAVDDANETRAHLAVVTGDLISMRSDPLDACLRQVARLRADAGILGCLGNHEIYARAEQYATIEGAKLGIRFLRNQAEQLHIGKAVLNIAGVDYQRMGLKARYLQGAEELVRPGCVNLLLSHNPDVFPVAAEKGYDLTLSGHTHGGQVTVEILNEAINLARFYTPFIYGLYQQDGPHHGKLAAAYVTRGIGTIGIPARVGAPPEISVLKLKRA